MRNKRQIWIANGKIHCRNNTSYIDYKTAKLDFRKQLESAYEAYLFDLNTKIEESVDSDQRFAWYVIKSNRKRTHLCQHLNVDGKALNSADEIREGCATHFESVFKYDSNLINSTNEQRVNKAVSDLLAFAELNNDHIEKFTYEEIYKLCESLPRNKSPGLDGISMNI